MEAILAYVKREPVVLLDAVKALLALVVVFGLPIPAGLDIALAGALVAVLTIVTRGKVSPVEDEEEEDEEDLEEEVAEESDPEVPAEDPIEEEADAVPRDEDEE